MVTELAAAYASCQRAAKSHYENFPVASLLVPPAMRCHVAALYAFARAADDFADEGSRTAGDRHGATSKRLRPGRKLAVFPSI